MSLHVHLSHSFQQTNFPTTVHFLTVPMVTVSPVPPISCLLRVMSESWMMRSGRSSLTSPMDEWAPLLTSPHPSLNPPRPPPLPLPVPLGSPLPPLPPLLHHPLDGPCVTWAPPLLRPISSLQLGQPGRSPTPQATPLTCRYLLSETDNRCLDCLRACSVVSCSYWLSDFLCFSLASDSTGQEQTEQDFLLFFF